MTTEDIEGLLRTLAPQALAAVVRRHGHFDAAEDAVQEALIAAAARWRERGVPERPRGWLIRVASRRLTDQLRRESAGRRREEGLAARAPADARVDRRMVAHHRLHAVRAHLHEMAGDPAAAGEGYRTAARLTTSLPELRYLRERAARLPPGDAGA